MPGPVNLPPGRRVLHPKRAIANHPAEGRGILVAAQQGVSADPEAVGRGQGRGLPVEEGILNYGKISDRLYRGAQPDAQGIANLKRLGVKLIVNLRMPGEVWKDEASLAEVAGIQYTNFPMSGFARPSENQIRQILTLFESATGPVFVHCLHGCDRTGTVVACHLVERGLEGVAAVEKLNELWRIGGRAETFMGLAGVGDLILTCTGNLSRNRRVGLRLAEGRPLAGILDELGHVAEGVYCAREIARVARERGIGLPITEAVCRVLDTPQSAAQVARELLERDPKSETL